MRYSDFAANGKRSHSTRSAGLPGARIDLLDGSGPARIHGQLIADGDVVPLPDGGQLRWTADALDALASATDDPPLMSRHSNRSRDVVGGDVAVEHREGGIQWQAELDDSDLADAVRNERLEVSVRATHADPEKIPTDDAGVHVAGAEHVGKIRHVALVPRGAAAGATAAAGPPTEPIAPATPGATTEPAAATTATAMSDSAGSADAPEPVAGEPVASTDAEVLAANAATSTARLAARREGKTVAEWASDRYGVDASEYDDERDLRHALDAAMRDDTGRPLLDAERAAGSTASATDADGSASASSTSDMTSDDEQLAASAAGASDMADATQRGIPVADLLLERHGVDARDYSDRYELRQAIMDAQHAGPGGPY